MRLASLGNQYVAEQAPWAMLEADRERAGTILYVALRAIDSLKDLLAPFLPFSAQRLHEMLGYDDVIAGPLEFRDGRRRGAPSHVVLTGDYAGWSGRWEPGRRCLPGKTLREPTAALPKLDPRRVVAEELARMESRSRRRDRRARASRRVRRAGGEPRRARAGSRRHANRHDRHRHRFVPRRARDRGAKQGVFAALGIDPHQAATPEAGRMEELRELLAHPKVVAVGRDGTRHGSRHSRLRSDSAGSSRRNSRSPTSSASPS